MSTEIARMNTEIEGMSIGIAKRNIWSLMMSIGIEEKNTEIARMNTEIAKKSIETEERNIGTARMSNSILKLYI